MSTLFKQDVILPLSSIVFIQILEGVSPDALKSVNASLHSLQTAADLILSSPTSLDQTFDVRTPIP